MNEKTQSLREAFTELDTRLDDPASPQRQELDEKLKGELAGADWVASRPEVVAKIAELLDFEVPPLLMRFWESAEEIRTALEESREKPKDPVYVGLAEHTAAGTLNPVIEVRIGQEPAVKTFEVRFTLDLECKLTGIELRLRDGEIRGIELGVCEVKGTLKYGDLVLAQAPREGQGRFHFGPEKKLPPPPPPRR